MEISHPQLIWANKPGCSKAVAELWIGENDLWCVIFLEDSDKSLKVEVLPSPPGRTVRLIDLGELERLVEIARHELLAMVDSAAVTV